MTCPNRDGTLGTGGCIFCSAGGSGDFASPAASACGEYSIRQQLLEGLSYFHTKKTGNRFIAYFQSYTNTYAPTGRLRSLYTEALEEPDVVGISIATRPDCLGDDVIALLSSLKDSYLINLSGLNWVYRRCTKRLQDLYAEAILLVHLKKH